MKDLPLKFQWIDHTLPSYKLMREETMLFMNGMGQSNGNVWSRAARRQRAKSQLHSSFQDGTQSESFRQNIFEFVITIVYGHDKTFQQQDMHTDINELQDDADDNDGGLESTTMIQSGEFERRLCLDDNNGKDYDGDKMMSDENSQSQGIDSGLQTNNQVTNARVMIRWKRGTDQVMWESFCGMLRSKIVQSW